MLLNINKMRFIKIFPEGKQIAKKLQSFFSKDDISTLSLESKFVQRDSPLDGAHFMNLCIQGLNEKGMCHSLNEMCVLALGMDVKICPQSLNERYNEQAVEFMKLLFNRAAELHFDTSCLAVLEDFSQVMLEDSTVVGVPEQLKDLFGGFGGSASKAAAKIDFTYDLKSTQTMLKLREGRSSDAGMDLPENIKPKSLWLRDLGYFKFKAFEQIAASEAYYISRFKNAVNIYDSPHSDAKLLDLLDLMEDMAVNEFKDIPVHIRSKNRLAVRLVIQKVPPEIAELKRQRLMKKAQKSGEKVSKRRLALCQINMYITNLDAIEYPPELIVLLYKIRWQIEILFKVWKSILKIGKTKKMKKERFLCLLYAQLIWALINMKVFTVFKKHFWNQFQQEISELKTYQIMVIHHRTLMEAILCNCQILYEKYLNKIFTAIGLLGQKQYKKGNPNPMFNLNTG